jgi:hypothetical protein
MNVFLIGALVALVPAGVVLVLLFRTLSSQRNLDISVDGGLAPAPGKYLPMARLLKADDFSFLAAQPGYSSRLGKRFRTERRRIFRAYLESLKKDFTRVSLTFQTLIVHSAEDRGDLAAGLVRQRMLFAFAMLAIEGRLLLHAAGVNTLTIDVSGMVESLETMQAQMSLLLTPPQASMAGA